MLSRCRDRVIYVLLIRICIFSYCAQAQQVKPDGVAALVDQYKSIYPALSQKTFFTVSAGKTEAAESVLNDYTSIQLDKLTLKNCVKEAPGAMELLLPYKNSTLSVELVKSDLFTEDFKVVTAESGGLPVTYQPGIYYRGVIKGEPSSVAAFSFFDHELVGLISSAKGNIVVGKQLNGDVETNEYIIYSDRDFKIPITNNCSTYEDPAYAPMLAQLLQNSGSTRTGNCVRMYYEADYTIYQNNGLSLNNTINWITAVHNNVATLYSNDNIKTAISEIFVWTQADPFTAASAVTQLNTFKSYRASFNGDIGQLLSVEPGTLGGIASAVNGLCNSDNKYAYSDVEFSFSTVPAYSWTVNVIAHEFGHLLGSYHTHSCLWPGGAIDNCGPLAGYPNEGGTCLLGPTPVDGGTVMSYCQLTAIGINFSKGFGPLPGDAIRSAVDASSCLGSSCVPNPPSYCLSKGQSTSSEWIQSVKLTTMNLVSGAGSGYSDFTNHVADLQPGTNVSIILTPGYAGTNYEEIFTVWIDYNKDLDFYDLNEKVFQSQPVDGAVTGTFTVPSGLAGNTRMRVSMKFDTASSTCESFKYGEVEDYTVSFAPLVIYCGSAGKHTDKEWIDYVKCGAIERESGADSGYFNGTSLASALVLNSENSLTFSAGFSGARFNESWKIWIDFNGNGVFENNETIINKQSNKKGLITKNFTVPSSATTGKTRMRVSMKRGDDQNPCDTFFHGEVEDYSIQIIPLEIGGAVEVVPAPLNVQVYPNPVQDELRAHFDRQVTAGHARLINLMGQVVDEMAFQPGTTELHMKVRLLTPGIYLLQVIIPGVNTETVKWTKL